MSKHKKFDRPKRKEIHVPSSIADAIDSRLRDRFTGRAVYGGWSGLVTQLLRTWLESAEAQEVEVESSKKTFCARCLQNLPLTAPCTNEECIYAPVQD